MNELSSSRIAVGAELWSERAGPLIRSAAALAAQFATPWLAIAVSDSTHALPLLTPEERQCVRDNTELVMSLGGAAFFCEGDDVAQTLLMAAATNGVKLLILGQPRERGIFSRIFGHEISTKVLHRATNVWVMFAAYPDTHAASR